MTFREKCIAMSYFSSIRSSPILNNFWILLKPAIPKFTCFCSTLFHFHFHPDPKHNEIAITISKILLNHSACNQTHASHTIPGLVLLLLLTAHRMPWMGSNPVSELWARGLSYLVCFLKCSLFTRNLILLATAGPLDICILFFNSAVISLFQCFF